MGDEDIFDDIGESKQNIKVEQKPKLKYESSHSRRTFLLIGFGVILSIAVLIYLGLSGIIVIPESEPFDASVCTYGTHSDFFGMRCITENEFIEKTINEELEKEKPEPVKPVVTTPSVIQVTPPTSTKPFKEVSSATDQVNLDVTKDPLGYYLVTTDDSWYGDYIDGREIPKKIDLNENTKVNFRCYTDNHLGTSTYFGTFKNNLDKSMKVEVYIANKLVRTGATDSGKALILEGSCYGQ